VPDDWTNLARRAPGIGRREALERNLRDAICAGRLPAGTRLPASRALARELGLARGTVVEAYQQLVAEGHLVARQGSGTTVAAAGARPAPAAAPHPPAEPPRTRISFHPGVGDLAAFPRALWLRAMRRVLAGAPPDVLGYGHPAGRPELREALAARLALARGMVTSPELVVPCAGFSHALALLARALRAGGARRIALEDPCIPLHREIVQATGLAAVPLPVDERGARTELLADLRVDAAVVTPAHQFPLGATLAPERRAALVDWARAAGGLVIEDDYDAELRYDRQPVGAVQGLEPERVATVGTVSKTLAPGLRLGWLALPPALAPPVLAIRAREDRHPNALDQLTLAELLASGALERHLRRLRARYGARRERLVAMLAERAPDLRVRGISAGLHALVEVPDEDALVAAAARRGIELFGLRRFWHAEPRGPGALVIGYGAPPEHAFATALTALGDLLEEAATMQACPREIRFSRR
jgi:GntR family transcriptional regulator/MocR family aminotransferase